MDGVIYSYLSLHLFKIPMFRVFHYLALSIVLCSSVGARAEIPFSVVADPWCPFNCVDKDEKPGIMIELAQLALQKSGITVRYKNVNWARAGLMVMQGEANGIVGMGKSPNTLAKFHFHEIPLAFSQVCFYRKQGSGWTFNGIESLKEQRIGRINKVKYGDPAIDDWLETPEGKQHVTQISGEGELLQRMIQMLAADRITTFGEVQANVDYIQKSFNSPLAIEVAGCLPNYDDLFIATTPNVELSQVFSRAMDEGLRELLAHPEQLQPLFDRYSMSLADYLDNLESLGFYPQQ